jgi:hypothetical protein
MGPGRPAARCTRRAARCTRRGARPRRVEARTGPVLARLGVGSVVGFERALSPPTDDSRWLDQGGRLDS